MTAEAVLLNPYQAYAELFIARLYSDYGIRTVALHTDWRTRVILEGRVPILRSAAVSAHYMIPRSGISSLVARLRRRHDVVAVVPHDEGAVSPLAELAEVLRLSWAQPEVLPAFRDKASLKALIARTDPAVRMNAFALVSSPQDVDRWVAEHDVGRFVLKPNDGSGNRDIAFFQAGDNSEQVARYLREAGGAVLAEEYVHGQEYWVNGQMDGQGHPTVTGIGRYDRRDLNGKPNLAYGGIALATTDPAFERLRAYAVQVMTATGLRRSPFHLEAMIDERGPCLIEVGARLCGSMMSLAESWQHGPDADLIGNALNGYVDDGDRGPMRLDWERYDTHRFAQVNGVSSSRQRLARVAGVAQVEQMPGFLFWIKTPHVGETVLRTQDLTQRPWAVIIAGEDEDELRRREATVRESIVLIGEDAIGPGLRARLPLYEARVGKIWSSRPRPYEAKALLA
ncbi:MAG: ATP-grasp protein [Actinomycetota bacterium]|nr:ATP-grasp protein [Actinomycetota bacterium]